MPFASLSTLSRQSPLVHEVADRRGRAVVVEKARAGADVPRARGVVRGEQRGRGRDEGEVEFDVVLLVEPVEGLLKEGDLVGLAAGRVRERELGDDDLELLGGG